MEQHRILKSTHQDYWLGKKSTAAEVLEFVERVMSKDGPQDFYGVMTDLREYCQGILQYEITQVGDSAEVECGELPNLKETKRD